MPELPDVAGFQRYIDSTSLHRRIEHTQIPDTRILKGVSRSGLARKLSGNTLESTARHGKFLFVETGGGGSLVLHFGMTGEVHCDKGDGLPDYTRLLLEFADGYRLAYQSKRMLGQVSWAADRRRFIEEHDLGPDALDDELDRDRFVESLAGRRGSLKAALMNQSVLAGIGNVYADEILFQAGISPAARLDHVTEKTLREIYDVMRRVLRVAARHGADVEQLPRSYLLPHREGDEHCPRCGAELEQQRISGRTAYFCPSCQSRS